MKTFTDCEPLLRYSLSGPTMGSRFSAVLLAEHRGQVRAAAAAAGVDPVTLYRLLRRRGVTLRRAAE